MRALWTIVRREWGGFFADPLALVLGIAFLSLSLALPLYFGGFFGRDQADLQSFFSFLPWVMLILAPALSMRSWAEEKRSGTIEMVRTWPTRLWKFTLGKFLAAWALLSALIILTFPLALTLSYLGDPDWGPVVSGYLGAMLLAGCYLAAGQFASSLSPNAVIAFVLGAAFCFILTFAGSSVLAGLFGWQVFGAGLPARIFLSLSAENYFQSMIDGLVEWSALLFFAAAMALFLVLASLQLAGRKRYMALAVLAFLALNALSATTLYRWPLDFTAESRHSLAPPTLQLLSKLDEAVDIHFYYSKNLGAAAPEYDVYARTVENLLRRYQAASGGRVRLYITDPEAFSEEEDEAAKQGLQPIPLYGGTQQAYFGLYAQSGLGRKGAVSVFRPEREALLEYDLTRLIYTLLHPEKPKIAVLTGLPMDNDLFSPLASGDGTPAPWAFWNYLDGMFALQKLPPDTSMVPDNAAALLIVHPRGLSEGALYAIDQYIMRHGKAVILLDPHCEAAAARLPANADAAAQSSDLVPLLTAWGISFDKDHVVADRSLAQRVVMDEGSRKQGEDYIAWLRLNEANIDRNDPATANLYQVNLATAGHFTRLNENVAWTPLLRSSGRSMLLPVADVKYKPDLKKLLASFLDGGEKYVLGARISGTLRSAFAQREGDKNYLAATAKPADIILLGDADLTEDRMWLRLAESLRQGYAVTLSDNADLIAGSLESMAGGENMAGLRSRDSARRPLLRLEAMRQAAEDKFQRREKELRQKLELAEARLRRILSESGDREAASQTVFEARSDIADARRELRAVQYELNRDIEGLQSAVRWGLVVVWPALAGVLIFLFTRIRRARKYKELQS